MTDKYFQTNLKWLIVTSLKKKEEKKAKWWNSVITEKIVTHITFLSHL